MILGETVDLVGLIQAEKTETLPRTAQVCPKPIMHEPSKRPIPHAGHVEWLVDCSCDAFHARVVRLEEEADIDIEAHRLNVRQWAQRLAHIYQEGRD